jgi:hypothetical protein
MLASFFSAEKVPLTRWIIRETNLLTHFENGIVFCFCPIRGSAAPIAGVRLLIVASSLITLTIMRIRGVCIASLTENSAIKKFYAKQALTRRSAPVNMRPVHTIPL